MTAPDRLRQAARLLELGQGQEARHLLGDVLADLAHPAPVPAALPGGFREALEQLRQDVRREYAEREAGPVWQGAELRALWKLLERAELLTLAPDPRDAARLVELAAGQGAGVLALAEQVAAGCPREAVGVNAEAEAVRLDLLGQLRDVQAAAAADRLRVLPLYLRSLQERGPVLRDLLEGLPASACPHGDAARVARVAHPLASGFRECWPLEDGAARLAALTAPPAPHAPRVVRVPVVRVLIEPDPPLAWEARVQVGGAWYGGAAWSRDGARPSDAEPLEGRAWEVRQAPGREGAELLPVRFPLAVWRAGLPYWRAWVPAPAEGKDVRGVGGHLSNP